MTAGSDNVKRCANSSGWWDQPVLSELNMHQTHQLIWVRANHMIYDYCSDTGRFPSPSSLVDCLWCGLGIKCLCKN
ncbi:putative xyloglucan:xyloglucosyl transferase [Helianthus anomalus]